MRNALILLLTTVALAWNPPHARAESYTTVTLSCTADCYISNSSPSGNQNATNPLGAYYYASGSIRKIYMRFDLSSIPATSIASAKLIFYNVTGTNPTVSVYGLNNGNAGETWGETTITWNNAPANVTTSNALQSGSVTSLGTFAGINNPQTFSSSSLRDFVNADTNNIVTFILLVNNLDTAFRCNNRETGPAVQLVVTYQSAPVISDLYSSPTLVQAGTTVQLGFRSSDPLPSPPTVLLGSHAATFDAADGLNYTYRYTATGTETAGWANMTLSGQNPVGIPYSASLNQAVYFKTSNPPTAMSLPFDAATTICTGIGTNQPFGLEDVDFDGDEDLVYETGSGAIALRKNDGAGAFGSATTLYTTTTLGRSLIVTDLDKDADPDAAFIAGPMNKIGWLANAGTGTFGTPRTICEQTTGATAIIAADLNRDAKTDIIYMAPSAGTIAWFRNAGGGNFNAPAAISTALTTPTAVVSADFDRDGDPDLAVGTAGGQIVLFSNNGSGSFDAGQVIATVLAGTSALTAVDLDKDGDMDISVTLPDTGVVCWLCNANGDAKIWYREDIPVPAGTASVLAVNIDADGDLDLLTASPSQTGQVWLENTDSSAMAWRQRTLCAGAGVNAFATADLDKDGDADLIATTTGGALVWYRNRSIHHRSTFERQTPPKLSDNSLGANAADFDGDGDLDLLITGYYVYWYENTGNPSSWPMHAVCPLFYWFNYGIGVDLDRDGDQDVLAYTDGNIGVLWFENKDALGTTWAQHTVSTTPYRGYSVFPADIDGDGDPDVVVPNNTYNSDTDYIYWYENTDGRAGAWTQHLVSTGGLPKWIYPVDMDLDGDIDLLAAHGWSTSGFVEWFENTAGNGSAWTSHSISSVRNANKARPINFDKDGDVDVLAAGNYDQYVWAWQNYLNGAGAPSLSSFSIGGTYNTQDVNGADYDADGDVDVFEADGAALRILYWQYNSGWGASTALSDCPAANSIEFADLNDDGNLDLIPGLWAQTSELLWFRNVVGHVALTGTAFGGGNVQQGATTTAMKLTAQHLGRSGDSAIRLLNFPFQITDQNGMALNQAQAGALIDSLSLVLDNGSGAYEPANDTVLLTTSSLTVDDYGQFSLIDSSNPNLVVNMGTNRTYFIVLTLKDNAASQAPYAFKIHLTHDYLATINTFDTMPVLVEPADIISSNLITAIGPPDILPDPDHVDFGGQNVDGSFSSPVSIRLRNIGLGPLHITSITTDGTHAADFSVTKPQGTVTLDRGTSIVLTASFRPLTYGSRSALIRITSDDPEQPTIEIPLTGTGLAPDIQVNPLSINFGEAPICVEPTTASTVSIANIGNRALAVSQVAIVGADAGQFTIQSDSGESSVAPSASRVIGIQFKPTSPGTKIATLRITSDDAETPIVNVSLTGSGLGADIQVIPASIEFGSQPAGVETTATTVTIGNIGNTELNINQVSIVGTDAGEFAIQSDSGEATVAPSASRQVSIKFRPTSAGAKTAALRIVSDDPATPSVDVALTGTGLRAVLVWVDFNWTLEQFGTQACPYNTFTQAVSAVAEGGTIRIKGDTARNWTTEHPRIQKAMRIEATGGPVRIGR